MQRLVAGLVLGLTAIVLLALLAGVDARSDRPVQQTRSGQGRTPEAPRFQRADPRPPTQADLNRILELREQHGGLLEGTLLGAAAGPPADALFKSSLEQLVEADAR